MYVLRTHYVSILPDSWYIFFYSFDDHDLMTLFISLFFKMNKKKPLLVLWRCVFALILVNCLQLSTKKQEFFFRYLYKIVFFFEILVVYPISSQF